MKIVMMFVINLYLLFVKCGLRSVYVFLYFKMMWFVMWIFVFVLSVFKYNCVISRGIFFNRIVVFLSFWCKRIEYCLSVEWYSLMIKLFMGEFICDVLLFTENFLIDSESACMSVIFLFVVNLFILFNVLFL